MGFTYYLIFLFFYLYPKWQIIVYYFKVYKNVGPLVLIIITWYQKTLTTMIKFIDIKNDRNGESKDEN